MARFADRILTPILVVLGLVLMVTPLALWAAWSKTVLLIVLATGATAAVLYCLLARFESPGQPGEAARRAEALPDDLPEDLPEELLDELQSLHPFVYHNRLTREGRARRVMRRLRTHLYGRPD